MDRETYNKFELFNRAGSFWTLHMQKAEREKIINLVDLTRSNNLIHSIENLGRGFGANEPQTFQNLTYTYNPEDEVQTYSSVGDAIVDFTTVNDVNAIEGADKYYVIPFILEDVHPVTIASLDGDLVRNIDFYLEGGHLWFNKPLDSLFAFNTIILKNGRVDITSFYSFTNRSETAYANVDLITDFYRNKLELRGLERATHVIAAMPIFRKAGRITQKNPYKGGQLYVTDVDEVVKVPFPHDELLVRQYVERDQLIEDSTIRFYLPDPDNDRWHRQVNWDCGLSLELMTIYQGLLLPDMDVYAFTNGEDPGSVNGSKVHARLMLAGACEVQDLYWDEVAKAETESGRYFNDCIGLGNEISPNFNELKGTTPGGLMPDISSLFNTKLVNPIDMFFKYILKDKTFIVEIDERYVTNKAEIVDFIRQNTPPDIFPIIRIRKSDTAVIDEVIEDYLNLHLLEQQQQLPILADTKYIQCADDAANDETCFPEKPIAELAPLMISDIDVGECGTIATVEVFNAIGDIRYQWYLVTVDCGIESATRLPLFDTATILVPASGTYYARAVGDCGRVATTPDVVIELDDIVISLVSFSPDLIQPDKTNFWEIIISGGGASSGEIPQYQWYAGPKPISALPTDIQDAIDNSVALVNSGGGGNSSNTVLSGAQDSVLTANAEQMSNTGIAFITVLNSGDEIIVTGPTSVPAGLFEATAPGNYTSIGGPNLTVAQIGTDDAKFFSNGGSISAGLSGILDSYILSTTGVWVLVSNRCGGVFDGTDNLLSRPPEVEAMFSEITFNSGPAVRELTGEWVFGTGNQAIRELTGEWVFGLDGDLAPALSKWGMRAMSSEVMFTDESAPALGTQPSQVRNVVVNGLPADTDPVSILITWDWVSLTDDPFDLGDPHISGWRVYRDTSPVGSGGIEDMTLVAGQSVLLRNNVIGFTDTEILAPGTYYYVVTGVNVMLNESIPSVEVTVTIT